MTETAQGGPLAASPTQTKPATEVSDTGSDGAQTRVGINPDMPSNPLEATGVNKDWGNRFCR